MKKTILSKPVTFTFLLISFFAISCNRNDVFFEYKTVWPEGWNKDSSLVYTVNITDTVAKYDIYINTRNRGEYPHQNLWLFISKWNPDSTLSKDSIDFYLADQRGKWLGSGIGQAFEMPVLYLENVSFPQAGNYVFSLKHGMRDSLLVGLNDVGLRIEKKE